MDFTPRSDSPSQPGGSSPNRNTAANSQSKRSKVKESKLLRWGAIILLFSVVILVIAMILSIAFSGSKSQSKYVNKNELQAVFLNGGQVYFGKITNLNNKFIAMSNIYYLRVNQQVQPGTENANAQNDVSLVKLGCELHGPQDQMIINTEQVVFWENLKSDGQVAQAVQEYVKQNPNGQNCEVQQSQNTNPATTAPSNNENQ